MKPTKMTSLLLSVVLSISMVMTPVGVVADDSVPSEEQTTEMTETTKETEITVTKKPAVKETENSETEETKASEKPVDKETKTTESEVPESTGEKATEPTEEKASESPKEETPEETKDKEIEESKPNESETVEGKLPEQTAKASPKNQSDSNPKTIHILDNVNNIYINIDIPDTNNYSWALNGNRGFIVRYINTGYHSPKEIMIGSAEDAEGYAEKYDMWKGMYDYAHDNPGAYDDSMYKKDFKDGVLIGNESTSSWFWKSGNYHLVIAVNGSPAEVEKLLGYITVKSGGTTLTPTPSASNPKTIRVLDNVNNIYINIDIPDTKNYSWASNGNRGFIVRYINTGYHSPKEIMIANAEDAEGYAQKYDMWKGMYESANDPTSAFNDNIYKKDYKDGELWGNDSTSTWFWKSGNYHFVIMVNGSPAEVEKLLGYITVRSGDGIQDDNPLAVKGKTATVKYKKLRKKSQTLSVSKVLAFTRKGQGNLTYAKVSGNKKIKINKTTGKITVKKKLKKKTYKVKIKVKAAGNDQYKPSGWKTVTIKIKVK